MADDKKGKGKPQKPPAKPMMQVLSTTTKGIKIKITMLNTLQKRWVRVELEDVIPSDGMFEVEREKEYVVKIPKGVTALNIKAIDVQTGNYDLIKVSVSPDTKKAPSPTEKPKDPMEIIGPCGNEKKFFVTVKTGKARQAFSFSSNKELTIEEEGAAAGASPKTGTHFDLKTGAAASLTVSVSFADTERKAILFFRVDDQNFKRMLIKNVD